jgi:hypothetical protein
MKAARVTFSTVAAVVMACTSTPPPLTWLVEAQRLSFGPAAEAAEAFHQIVDEAVNDRSGRRGLQSR